MTVMKRSFVIAVVIVALLILGVTTVSAQSRTYIVGSGDVLDLIAAFFNVDQNCIVAATPGLYNPSQLYPGQRLVIPTLCAPYYGGASGNGRIKGRIFASPAPVPPPGDQGGGGTYTVRPGDQLAWIARYYGVTVQCLMNVNGIRNPNLLYAGTRLSITPCLSPQVGLPTTPSMSTTTYTVQAGDRLSDIAQRFGVDVGCLVRVNALANQNFIRRGQVLQIGGCTGQGGPLASQNYTVQRGDRLSNIAATFDIDAQCLIAANNIGNPNHIEAGDVLVIDYSACGASG